MIEDVNLGTEGSSFRSIVVIGDALFMSANDGAHGAELWRSDGTEEGTALVADIAPGDVDSSPSNLVPVGDRVLFCADDGAHGAEPWATDGTAGGTALVADVNPGDGGSCQQNGQRQTAIAFGDAALLFLDDGEHGREPWRTDGTAEGTVLVADIHDGPDGSSPGQLTALGDTVLFTADDGASGEELWRTDGTTEGTALVADIREGPEGSGSGPDSSGPSGLTAFGDAVLFVADDGVSGYELWRSDGTADGTYLLADVHPGSEGSELDELTAATDAVFFVARSITEYPDDELWKSDGTPEGTVMVADVSSSHEVESDDISWNWVYQLMYGGGELVYFSRTDEIDGEQLWRSDGTGSGTFPLESICPSPDGWLSIGAPLGGAGGAFFFTAICSSSVAADEAAGLWRSDGTEAGTSLVKEFAFVFDTQQSAATLNGVLYFSGTDSYVADGFYGVELWRSDGTEQGTALVADLNTQGSGSYPSQFVRAGGRVFFTADDGIHGEELWAIDDGADGARLVADIEEGDWGAEPMELTAIGDRLFFVAYQSGHHEELWTSDGTTDGTRLVVDIGPEEGWFPGPYCLTAFGDRLIFGADDGIHGEELWVTDGTETGTALVADIAAGADSSSPGGFEELDGALYFAARTAEEGRELWVTDGTEIGTLLVKNICYGSLGAAPYHLTAVDHALFFTAGWEGTSTGRELWTTDGTADGTHMVLEIGPGSADGEISSLTALNGALLFFADDGAHGLEPWISDGTAEGTAMIADVLPGGGSSLLDGEDAFAAISGSRAVLFLYDGEHGFEPWATDGTADGTALVADIVPGPDSSMGTQVPIAYDGEVFFGARDEEHGEEPWRTDGTAEGTSLLADVAPGVSGSQIMHLRACGDGLYFTADDGATGLEPWVARRTP